MFGGSVLGQMSNPKNNKAVSFEEVTTRNCTDIPVMNKNKHYDCDKCMFYLIAGKKRTAKNKKEWFEMMKQKYGLSGGMILSYDGKPAGYAQFAPKSEFIKLEELNKGSTQTDAWYISCIAILKKYRGKGLGKLLLKKVINILSKAGVKKVQACGIKEGNADDYSSGYWSMYEQLGFEEIGREGNYVIGELKKT